MYPQLFTSNQISTDYTVEERETNDIYTGLFGQHLDYDENMDDEAEEVDDVEDEYM